MKIITKYWKGLLSIIFGFIVLLFWMFPYADMLNFHEQFQLFLFDTDYFISRITVPGGAGNYIAEFLTQFYYVPFIGALIIAVIYVMLQRLLWLLAKDMGATTKVYLLSFVPSILLWILMCSDTNVLLCFAVSILLTLTAVCFIPKTPGYKRFIYCMIAIPCLYWLLGSVVYVFILCAGITELRTSASKLNATGLFLLDAVYAIAVILLTSISLQYPISRLFYGLSYYRFPSIVPYTELMMMAVFTFTPLILAGLSKLMTYEGKKKNISFACQFLIIAIGSYFILNSRLNSLDYEFVRYDSMVRHQQWDKIISEAEKKNPTTPQSVCCLNLALAKTDQLGDKAFTFYQNGSDGLLPEFKRDFTSPLPASEVYFYLGMINAAQQNTFEAQEAIPNYNKSTRCTKRLAETNLINGQYAVASKYLRMLQKTLFYRGWATEQLDNIANKMPLAGDPLYGALRQFSYDKDFLFSVREKDKMIGKLFTISTGNKMALEYLLTYELLDCNINNFLLYFKLMKMANFDHFPMSYQQALAFVWSQSHQDFNGIPDSYDQSMLQRFMDFYQIYSTEGKNSPKLDQFKDTYWHYFLVQK